MISMIGWMSIAGCMCNAEVWFEDLDGDGYGNDATEVLGRRPPGHVAIGGDCDDTDANVNPDALEVCNDGVDDDCNGLADDADPDVDLTDAPSWFVDADGDGHGDPLHTEIACGPVGYAATGLDCDDSDDTRHEGVFWVDELTGDVTDVTSAFRSGTPANPHRFEAPGDGRLEVCSGEYYATVFGAEALHVVGLGLEPESTVLDGGFDTNLEPIPIVSGPADSTLTVESMALRNGAHAVVGDRNTVTLLDLRLTKSGSPDGFEQAIRVSNSTLTVRGLQARDNPGVVLYADSGEIDLHESVFERNGREDLVWVVRLSSEFTMRAVQLHDNAAVGSVLRLLGSGTVEEVEITDNAGRGMWLEPTHAGIVVRDSLISGNTAAGDGGGVRVEGLEGTNGGVTFEDTLVTGNTASGLGGGLYLRWLRGMVSCTGGQGPYGFVGNTAGKGGGGAYVLSNHTRSIVAAWSTLDARGCDFGAADSVDDNSPDDVVYRHEVYSCEAYGPCALEKAEDAELVAEDDATFCVGLLCP